MTLQEFGCHMSINRPRVAFVVGTRPEAIKVAPVFLALRDSTQVDSSLLSTGQHKEQLASALSAFGLEPDFDLDVMTDRQTLPDLAARLIVRASAILAHARFDRLVVQGDTMSAYCLAFAAFLAGIPTFHIEAGLRSGSLEEPFPEEASRRLISVLSALDFAPTQSARRNLLAEGKDPSRIIVTGQTAVDAIRWAASRGALNPALRGKQLVTVTMHRRENWELLADLARVLAEFAAAHRELTFVYPVHLNPVVRASVIPILSGVDNFQLLEPLDYLEMAGLLARSEFIITDSGGLQEEGVSLGIPVFVLRNVTERPEGLETGGMRLLGNEPERVRESLNGLLSEDRMLTKMRNRPNPYGDGRAAERCAQAILWNLGLADAPSPWALAPSNE